MPDATPANGEGTNSSLGLPSTAPIQSWAGNEVVPTVVGEGEVIPPLPSDSMTTEQRLSIPGYAVLEVLGRGGMGVVYKALQVDLNRFVALKMILSGAHAGPDELTRFRREAEAIARLRHPNIVQIYQVGEHEGRAYFSLEFVDGGCLAQQLSGTPQPARRAAELVEVLARALAAAHECGIVHRDLKPHNVLVSRDGTLKVTDFGLAKRVDADGDQTPSGAVVGTPSYMAPEQAAGKTREVGPLADVYALGVILYEALTGRPPFRGETAMDTVLQVISDEPVLPSRLRPKLPHDLETICLKCLHKQPARRYGSARDLADDLRRFLNGEPIHARPVGSGERALKWCRRHPTWAALIVASVLTACSVLAGALLYARSQRQQALLAERELNEAHRLGSVQEAVRDRIETGNRALDAGDWATARTQLTSARDLCSSEPSLANLKARAVGLLEQIDRRLADEARYQTFVQKRHDALFHATLFSGNVDLAYNLKETQTAAGEALALYGVTVESDARPTLDGPFFTPDLQSEIIDGCYEMLLVVAEAQAQPRPGQSIDERREQAAQALRTLDRAARLGLTTQTYHVRRARYLERKGDATAAQEEQRRAEKVALAGPLDSFLAGDELFRRGNPTGAIAAFQQTLHLQPNQFWAQYFLAICYLKTNRPDAALDSLTTSLGRRPDFTWGLLLRGFTHGELGAAAQARGRGDEAEFHFRSAEEDFRKVLEQKPNELARYGLYVNRATVRLRHKRFAEAEADLHEAIQLRPQQYQAHVNLAQAYQQQDRLDDAIAQLDQAIQLEPRLPALYDSRARLHLKRRDTEAARRDFEKVADLKPADRKLAAEAHVERGRLLLAAGQFAEALAAFDAALATSTAVPRAQRWRAEALLQLAENESDAAKQRRHHEAAVRALDRYLTTEKPTAEVYRSRGRARAKLGDYMGAADDYTLALDLQPDSATRIARGWALVFSEAPKLALRDFDEAIVLNPDSAEGYGGRGYVRVKAGQVKDAVADAEQAARRGAKDARMLSNAARIYAQAAAALERAAPRDRPANVQRSQYEDRACEFIRNALALLPGDGQRGQFWKQYVGPDSDLAPLQKNERFIALARNFPAPAR